VYRFRELLEKTVDSGNSEEVILSIGQLMNDSQKSCREDYECSCEALDELISIAQANGSLGSRLTGELSPLLDSIIMGTEKKRHDKD
jgi:galactokinase